MDAKIADEGQKCGVDVLLVNLPHDSIAHLPILILFQKKHRSYAVGQYKNDRQIS